MARMLRENAHLSAEGWSDWLRAMIPAENIRDEGSYESRGARQTGVMCTNIRGALPDEMSKCGIYEWQARRPGRQNVVIYVGCTCRDRPGSLRARILEYCVNGAHKSPLINEALKKGNELFVRVKTSGDNSDCNSDRSKETAQNMENELLKKYDYAWNIRNNAMRDIL